MKTINSRLLMIGVLAGITATLLVLGANAQPSFSSVLYAASALPILIAGLGWGNIAAIVSIVTAFLLGAIAISPSFALVMPSGAVLDRASLRDTFAKLNGARPGSKIQIREMALIAEYPSGAVVKYREYQRDNAGNANVRRSTAVMELDAHGKVAWRHLHETFCTE